MIVQVQRCAALQIELAILVVAVVSRMTGLAKMETASVADGAPAEVQFAVSDQLPPVGGPIQVFGKTRRGNDRFPAGIVVSRVHAVGDLGIDVIGTGDTGGVERGVERIARQIGGEGRHAVEDAVVWIVVAIQADGDG